MLHTEDPQVLGITAQNLVTPTTGGPGFVHPYIMIFIFIKCV